MATATFKRGAKVERWERNLESPQRALKQIGALMVAESQQAFREQRFGTKAWPPRSPVNVFGIIADFAEGKRAPPARRFQRSPALRDTGRLAASIAFRVEGDSVSVGSNLDYAAVHQKGGATESETITGAVQRALWRWLREQGPERKRQLGWLLNRKFRGEKLDGEVPARPFVGITRQTMADVREVIGVSIMEAK